MEISDVKAVKVNDSSMKVPQKVPHFKVGTRFSVIYLHATLHATLGFARQARHFGVHFHSDFRYYR